MNGLKVSHQLLRALRKPLRIQCAGISVRVTEKSAAAMDEKCQWPRKIFSGIQPSGTLHLGNYLGAVQKWIELQNAQEDVTYCIVDMHSITLPQNPAELCENIFELAATILACGLNPDQSNIFVQSAVMEHTELCWILSCICTMARLGQLPQFKEKSRSVRDVPLGLYVYPVLQAADIMLHKATHVPVGEDQLQHIQLAQHLAKLFNNKYGPTFPICHAMIENQDAARIRSLRNPSKKMSKSDLDTRATINIRDSPDVIMEKIKKAVTDFTSDVSYDPNGRPGVSNLVAIHSLVTGQAIEKVVEEANSLDTGRYKIRVAEAVIEHLKPIRSKIDFHLTRRNELIYILELGAEKARQLAQQTMLEVKQKMGLGTFPNIPQSIQMSEAAEEKEKPKIVKSEPNEVETSDMPIVPKQKMRIEKKRTSHIEYRLAPLLEPNPGLLPATKPPSNVNTAQESQSGDSVTEKFKIN